MLKSITVLHLKIITVIVCIDYFGYKLLLLHQEIKINVSIIMADCLLIDYNIKLTRCQISEYWLFDSGINR